MHFDSNKKTVVVIEKDGLLYRLGKELTYLPKIGSGFDVSTVFDDEGKHIHKSPKLRMSGKVTGIDFDIRVDGMPSSWYQLETIVIHIKSVERKTSKPKSETKTKKKQEKGKNIFTVLFKRFSK